MSERAREIYTELYPVVESVNHALLASLSDADLLHLERIFALLEHNASDLLGTGVFPKADRSKQHAASPPRPRAL